MGTAKFAGHFGTTHPAGKMLPKEEAASTKGDWGSDWYNAKRYHNRKSRYWLRDQTRRLIKNETSKL